LESRIVLSRRLNDRKLRPLAVGPIGRAEKEAMLR
jgi:hypothetical protein